MKEQQQQGIQQSIKHSLRVNEGARTKHTTPLRGLNSLFVILRKASRTKLLRLFHLITPSVCVWVATTNTITFNQKGMNHANPPT